MVLPYVVLEKSTPNKVLNDGSVASLSLPTYGIVKLTKELAPAKASSFIYKT